MLPPIQIDIYSLKDQDLKKKKKTKEDICAHANKYCQHVVQAKSLIFCLFQCFLMGQLVAKQPEIILCSKAEGKQINIKKKLK